MANQEPVEVEIVQQSTNIIRQAHTWNPQEKEERKIKEKLM
jgi:hypothetical protein